MPTTEDRVSLETLGQGGAAVELFNAELQRVLDNIQDVNTDPKKCREVALKLKIKPDKDRAFAVATIDVSSKIAPQIPFETKLFLGIDRNSQGIAREYMADQKTIPDAIEEAKNIVHMRKEVSND